MRFFLNYVDEDCTGFGAAGSTPLMNDSEMRYEIGPKVTLTLTNFSLLG